MTARLDIRKLALTMAIIVGLVAIAVPACQMVACGMAGEGMTGGGSSLQGSCGIAVMHGSSPAGSLPAETQSLLFTLAIALAFAVALPLPRLFAQRARWVASTGLAAPPIDPQGVRLLI